VLGVIARLCRQAKANIPVAKEFREAQMSGSNQHKAKLPSRHVTEGPEKAPHRSYLYAMGLSEEEIHQPLVGVATCWN